MKRLGLFVLLAGCLASASIAAAQDKYPSKGIKVLVPYAPGGAVDIVARIVTEQMRQSLGQPFVVENKPGAFGIIAIEEMSRAKPDGYTIMFGNTNTHAITPVLFKKKMAIDFDKDVVAVARLADVPAFVSATTTGFAPKTFAEFIAYAKSNPGKVRYTSVGVGSFPHYDMEILARRAGIDLIHIPNKAGAAGSVKDLATGDSQVGFVNVATSASLIRGGQIRPLAVITEARLPDYPDVLTIGEMGFPGVGTLQWLAMFAPAGVPKDVLETLHKAAADAVNSAAVQEAFKKQIIRPLPTKSPDDARDWLASEIALWRKIADEVKVDLAD